VALAVPATGTPLAPVGELGVRRDLDLLWEAGAAPGPVWAWPMSWDALDAATGPAAPDDAGGATPAWVTAAARRLRQRMPGADRWRLEALAWLATDRNLLYGFDGGARRDVDLRLTGERTWNRTTVSLAVGYRNDEHGAGQVVLDGSYLSQGLGNWVVYGGAAERWYGPGLDAGLVLSRNARPVPGVGVFRDVPRRSHHALLRWMGPWRVDAFLGVLEGPRPDFRNPLLLNLHWSLQPWPRLNLAFTRGIMICGEGRPCGVDTWLRALFGVFDLDNTGDPGDASNQTASVSLAYAFPVGAGHLTPYTEFYIEDEIKFFSVAAGARAAGPLGDRGHAWRARAEYCDTYANRSFGTGDSDWLPVRPGVTYRHYV